MMFTVVRTLDGGFGHGDVRLNSAFEARIAREEGAAIAGNLMESFDIGNPLVECLKEGPREQ
jgi:Na+/citrate or Na+/malate symporter